MKRSKKKVEMVTVLMPQRTLAAAQCLAHVQNALLRAYLVSDAIGATKQHQVISRELIDALKMADSELLALLADDPEIGTVLPQIRGRKK